MIYRSFCSYSLSLLVHALLSPGSLADSSAPGKLNLYDDFDCEQASTLNPTVNLALSTCLVTPGCEGLVIALYPPCPSSTASLIYYQDTSCGVQTNYVSTSLFAASCFQLASGVNLFNARSVMFSCQPAADNPQPSSTTTAVVSELAGVATGSAAASGGASTTSATGPGPTGPATASGGGTATSATTSGPPSTTGGSTSSSSPTAGTSSSSSSGSGLSSSDIIAIAVGLGIGIPTIAIMLVALLVPDIGMKLRRLTSSFVNHTTFNHGQQRHWGPNDMQGSYQMQQRPPPYNPVHYH